MNINGEEGEKEGEDHSGNEIEDDQILLSKKGDSLLQWKDKGKVEEEDRCISQTGEDDLRPQHGVFGTSTIYHDEFSHIPRGEGEDETREKPVGDIFGVAGEDNQTEGNIHGKGQSSRQGQNVHRTPYLEKTNRSCLETKADRYLILFQKWKKVNFSGFRLSLLHKDI
jgi:hypothetical protein